jgi:hypothetical protein
MRRLAFSVWGTISYDRGMTEDDIASLRKERDALIEEVLARPAPTAYFQTSERIDRHLERSNWRERRIEELDDLIAAHEADASDEV